MKIIWGAGVQYIPHVIMSIRYSSWNPETRLNSPEYRRLALPQKLGVT